MTEKEVLRKGYRSIRESLVDIKEKSERIAELFLAGDEYKKCDTLFAYYPKGSEVSTRRIIEKALEDDKIVTLPKCLDKHGTMEFYYIESLKDLSLGAFGIYEPKTGRIADPKTKNSLCLVPAIAYDVYGYRLGYGGGYYDRYLARFSGKSVGLCYEECYVNILPHEKTDKKVNFIVTEKEYIKIKEEPYG